MKKIKDHIKILSALSLASSDARNDTFVSVVVRTLFEIAQCDKKDLGGFIKEQFGFEPYKSELNETVKTLLEDGIIITVQDKLQLSEAEKERIESQDIETRDKEKARFQNFKNFIKDELGEEIETNRIKLLWATFLEYLYNSFYEYGEDALRTLHPHIETEDGNAYYENILSSTMKKLDSSELKGLFKEVIERFPDFASKDDINFLNELAQKTLSFSSLGFEPENGRETIKHDIVDWVLYLDTNVIYSLLDLHAHPENESCKALIHLIRDNQEHVNIKLRYSEITYKELGYKKSDFDLLDDKLTDNSIQALLKSDKLDGFSQKFYENLLENRDATIHPSEAIELSQATLKRKAIDIGRNGKRIEHLGENYIDAKVQDFYSFINRKNEDKMDFCESKGLTFHPIDKSEKQAIHDITLRELLLDSRSKVNSGDEISLNSVKYFAVTLDDLLIRFDRSQLRDYNDERSFPVFFKPSYLLNKLVRVLPIKTDDYKKAFIKAVTSKGFHKESKKSRDVLKIVNYLKSQGVDDEKVVYNIISQDIFLDKFHQKSKEGDFNQGEFIQSELNREFQAYQDQLKRTKEVLDKESKSASLKLQENKKLERLKKQLDKDVEQYKTALKKLNARVKQLEESKPAVNNQGTIEFDVIGREPKEKEESEVLKRQLQQEVDDQIDKEKDIAVKNWQKKVWWNLIWVVPLTLTSLFFTLPFDQNPISDQSNRFTTGGVIIAPVLIIFLLLIRMRYWDESNKRDRRENHRISEELNRKKKRFK